MADLSDLARAIAGVQEKSTYSNIGDALSGIKWNPSDYSLGENLGASLGLNLISGLFGGIGANREAEQKQLATELLSKAMMGEEVTKPEGMWSSVFSKAQEPIGLFKIQNKLAEAQSLAEISKARKMKEAEKLGELDAYGGTGAGANLLNPIFKEKVGIETKARDDIKNSKVGTEFQDIKINFNTMLDTYGYNDKGSSLAFISSFARLLDPGSVVREGEIKNVENTQGLLSGLGYNIKSLVDGTQTLSPDAKKALIRAGGAKYNNYGQAFTDYLESQKTLVGDYGGDPKKIFAPIKYEPFAFTEWAKQAPDSKTVEEEITAGDPDRQELLKLQAELQAGINSGTATEADKKAVLEKAKSIYMRSQAIKPTPAVGTEALTNTAPRG